MIQKIKTYLMVTASLFMMSVPVMVPAAASAACNNISDQVQKGANAASSSSVDCNTQSQLDQGNLQSIASKIVNLFSVVVGAIAIIMLIYGGFRYITSGGASERVGNAKNTIIYAIVGLIIVALAQVIVHFVLNVSNQVTQT